MPFFYSYLLSICVGIFTTFICIYLLKPVAIHIGLIDRPGGRKTHVAEVPLIGGISIFMGFCFSLLCLDISLKDYRGLLAGSAILVLIGIMDDFKELTPRVRLIGQGLASLLLVQWGHLTVTHLGNLFFLGNVNLGFGAFFLTIFLVLAFINAINMIDGHDGLAGGVICTQAILLTFLSMKLNQTVNIYLLILFIMCLMVFLSFNFPIKSKRASIFMGDAGSTFIGFVIAWFAVNLSQATFVSLNDHLNPLSILWVLSYPLYDLVSVILYRLRAGSSPFAPSRDHFHYILIDNGFSKTTVTLFLIGLSIILGLLGILLAYYQVPEPWQLLIFFWMFILYFLFTFILRHSRTQTVRSVVNV